MLEDGCGEATRRVALPNAAFYRSQADAYCKLAQVIESGETVTSSGLILAEELRDLARQFNEEAERQLIVSVRPDQTPRRT